MVTVPFEIKDYTKEEVTQACDKMHTANLMIFAASLAKSEETLSRISSLVVKLLEERLEKELNLTENLR